MEFVLDASLVYAEQRQQFGQTISAFQAVQHHLVLIAEGVAAMSAAVDMAVRCAPQHRLMMVATAKTILGDEAATVARLAHQVHGAIGATEEHPIQLRTRRLWSWQDEFGTMADWAAELADQLIFPESPGAWPVLTPPLAALSTRTVGEGVPW
jgi:acyl-CoA dehydrogenase